jgi:ribonuclease-3 family protein
MMEQPLFYHPPAKPVKELNPLVLAYAGDAIYDLFIRQYMIAQANHRPNHMHRTTTRYVSAKAQSMVLEYLELSEEEQDIVKRGRNAKSGSSPKKTDILQYRHSTAFECLLGYLYYEHRHERLREIMEHAVKIVESKVQAP